MDDVVALVAIGLRGRISDEMAFRMVVGSIRDTLRAMTPDERAELEVRLFSGYCRSCWTEKSGPCHCENDE